MDVPATTLSASSGSDASTPVSRTATFAEPLGLTDAVDLVPADARQRPLRAVVGVVRDPGLLARAIDLDPGHARRRRPGRRRRRPGASTEYMRSAPTCESTVAPAALRTERAASSDTPGANVTMYGSAERVRAREGREGDEGEATSASSSPSERHPDPAEPARPCKHRETAPPYRLGVSTQRRRHAGLLSTAGWPAPETGSTSHSSRCQDECSCGDEARHRTATRGALNRARKGTSWRVLTSTRRMSSQYIYSMYKLSRTHPPDKQVLKDISLSFFPGAKIGVLGLNGSGKSTLLRIMAGQDQDYRGEAQLAPGATVGMLEQEPQLDESQGRARQRRGRRRRDARAARPLQRARRRTTPTRPPTSSRACRTGSTRPTRGTSTPSSTRRWTRCASRRPTRR